MTKKKINIWACDFSESTGEGRLGRLFIRHNNYKELYKLKLNKKKNRTKYMSTFSGILFCWEKYLKKEKVCYLNYLPLWNFILFILLPPKTILGPITGGAIYTKDNIMNYFIRDKIFPLFYKISEYFLSLRSVEIIFSTNLLKKYLSNEIIKKAKFNFVLNNILFKKINIKKDIDFLIYHRRHSNKKNFLPRVFIKNLILKNLNIHIVGDKLEMNGVKNHGIIKNTYIQKLQLRSKYTVASGENIYSFFTIESLSNGVKVLIDKKDKKQIKFYKKKFIFINFNKIINLKNLKN